MDTIARPSTQFIKRGIIAILVLFVILFVQSKLFERLVQKRASSEQPTTTVGDLIVKDSNGNSIPDWEERLWGLDPTVLYTNGVAHTQIIAEKKRSLGTESSEADLTTLSQTERLARELFTLTAALGETKDLDDTTVQGIAEKLGDSVTLDQVKNHYTLAQLQTVKTTTASLATYLTQTQAIIARATTDSADIDALVLALENGDTSKLTQLATTASAYKNLAEALRKVPTPVGLARTHLALINGLYGIGESCISLAKLPEDGVQALVGIALYRGYNDRVLSAVAEINEYMESYGIL